MESLDYHPDRIARSLKTGRTQVVGVMLPDITNPFFAEVVRAIEDYANRSGYSVIVCNSNGDASLEQRHLEVLLSHRVDGLLISCCDPFCSYDVILRRRVPMVFFDRLPRALNSPAVTTDNLNGAFEATRRLIELKHDKIAIIGRSTDASPQADRVEGFRRAMQKAHVTVRDEYFCIGLEGEEAGYDATLRLLNLPDPPTAIFCTNNSMLFGVARAIAALALPCPESISVIGFDDHPWTRTWRPGLSVVAQPTREIGTSAMKALLACISRSGPERPAGIIRLPAELRVRQSIGPAPSAAIRRKRGPESSTPPRRSLQTRS
jgi:LacI family transcriptional regulator